MSYTLDDVARVAAKLKQKQRSLGEPAKIWRSQEMRDLVSAIKDQPTGQRAAFGRAVNQLKLELQRQAQTGAKRSADKPPIDITAPFDVGGNPDNQPRLMTADQGSIHPITRELERIENIFLRMGFRVEQSRLLDDDYHMFGALNFPQNHPARDDYDTFMTEEDYILPAHTSTMQHRILRTYAAGLKRGQPVAAIIPGRVFRNEDVDATHEHTFHQVEGIYVNEGVSLADMLGTIQTFLEAYFEQAIEFKTQPFYFPFVEPGLEYLIKTPDVLKSPGGGEWLEIMGCGMIHPNVLSEAGIDPQRFSGFAWGMGVERLVMLKYGVDDIRHFMSGRLDFLRGFGGLT